jgi:signal transduction histidine kinase
MKWENRTQRWEDMTQRAVESSETAAKNTFVTQNLIRENTDITMQVADQTNGRLRELAEATKRGAVLRARMHERVAASGDAMAADDLDHMEKEFQQEEQQIKKETTAKNNET